MEERSGLSVNELYSVCGKLTARVIVDHLHCKMDHQLPVTLSYSLFKQILGYQVSYRDLEFDDPEYFNTTIRYLLENDPEDLELTFEESIFRPKGTSHEPERTVALMPGSNASVNEGNKMQYLKCVAEYRLRDSKKKHLEAFVKGFHSVLPYEVASMFTPQELSLLSCSSPFVDVEDMEKHTIFNNATAQQKEWFWNAVRTITDLERKKLLQFITGSSSIPPLGFRDLTPQLTINPSFMRDSLPMSHTCMNTLDLPEYSSYNILLQRLLVAINECQSGFGNA